MAEHNSTPEKRRKIPFNELVQAERVVDGLHELNTDITDSPLANEDIVPVPVKERTWSMWNLASLWVGISVCIPTYMLAAGLISSGMNWTQAVMTILLGNAIVLIPLCLNAYPGTKYGIPFPVLIRSSFGTVGAHIPSVLRGLVACGWFGIQTWIGGKAIYELAKIPLPQIAELGKGLADGFLGITGGELLCFLIFWAIHMLIVWKGVESIKVFETWAAPALILVGVALFVWAINTGGGLSNVLDHSEYFTRPTMTAAQAKTNGDLVVSFAPVPDVDGAPRIDQMRMIVSSVETENEVMSEQLTAAEWQPIQTEIAQPWPETVHHAAVWVEVKSSRLADVSFTLKTTATAGEDNNAGGNWWLTVFLPLLTAMVGFWATLSLNIPDFTRYAKTQKDQIMGQAIGLPTTMTLYAFVGVVATCASLIAFPNILVPEAAPWDPVALLANFDIPWMVILSMAVLAIATLTTNIAANVVAPANGFSNLAPNKISFRMGGFITGIIGILMMPWKLLASAGAYIFTWLIGYSALMGGIAGVMIADYYIVRKRKLDLLGLYQPDGPYRFTGGVNWVGVIAFVLGVLPNIPGFLVQVDLLSADLVPPFLQTMYSYAWFSGFFISFIFYAVVMPFCIKPIPADKETDDGGAA